MPPTYTTPIQLPQTNHPHNSLTTAQVHTEHNPPHNHDSRQWNNREWIVICKSRSTSENATFGLLLDTTTPMSIRNTHEILRLSDGKSFSDITYHQTHLERSQRIKTSHTALRSRFAQSLSQDRFKQLLLHSCFMVVVWYERT